MQALKQNFNENLRAKLWGQEIEGNGERLEAHSQAWNIFRQLKAL